MTARKPSPAAQGRGEALVEALLAEMAAASVEPDAKERALLETARQIVNRIDSLERIIAADGELLTTRTGVRMHPAVAEHRQLAGVLPKVLIGIVIGDSSAGLNPSRQAAASARWRREAKLRAGAANG